MLKQVLLFICVFTFNALRAQQPVTPRVIYDFNTGDEFHYTQSEFNTYSLYSGFSHLILGKSYNTDSSAVSYYVRVNRYRQNLVPGTGQVQDTTYSTEIDTLVYTDLDSNIKFLPDYNVAAYNTYQSWYNFLASSDSSCLSSISYTDSLNTFFLGGIPVDAFQNDIVQTSSSCSNVGRTYSSRFGRGIGLIYALESASGGPNYVYITNLVFYKKGSTTAGTPVNELMTGLKAQRPSGLSFYPNPASDFIRLVGSSTHSGTVYQIFDLHGRQVETGKLESNRTGIDVSNLESGMYVFKLHNQSPVKFTVQH